MCARPARVGRAEDRAQVAEARLRRAARRTARGRRRRRRSGPRTRPRLPRADRRPSTRDLTPIGMDVDALADPHVWLSSSEQLLPRPRRSNGVVIFMACGCPGTVCDRHRSSPRDRRRQSRRYRSNRLALRVVDAETLRGLHDPQPARSGVETTTSGLVHLLDRVGHRKHRDDGVVTVAHRGHDSGDDLGRGERTSGVVDQHDSKCPESRGARVRGRGAPSRCVRLPLKARVPPRRPGPARR